MTEKGDLFFKILLIGILLVNTFFLCGIWCTLKYSGGYSSKYCPWTKDSSPMKICPITGKPLDMKGSSTGK